MAMAEPAADDDNDAPEPELEGPVRLCALSRTVQPIEHLVRFVAGPDGVIVPDVAQRLPGRGIWVECDRQRLAEAVRRNVFAKSLKRPVKVPGDLPETVEALLVKRVLGALSLANKSGLVVPGFTKCDEAIETGRVAALFHGQDGAPDGRVKLDRKLAAVAASNENMGVIVTELTIDQISLAIGRANVVHAAITSGGAATRLLDEARRLMRYRADPGASQNALAP
jgi:uncharacterized protein